MKRIILIFLLLMFVYNGGVCQDRMLDNVARTKVERGLPYKSCDAENSTEMLYGFPIDLVLNTSFQNSVWTDLGLTQQTTMKIDLAKGDVWSMCHIDGKFAIDNQDFVLFTVLFGTLDYCKNALVTIDNNGNYIDSISVGASISSMTAKTYEPMQWEITSDMKVIVYQLKPTSITPIPEGSDIGDDGIEAQRIDRVYLLGSDGKFAHVETKYYKPQLYQQMHFIHNAYDISTGVEQLQY